MGENSLKIARDRDKMREPLVKLNQLFVTNCLSPKMLNCKNGSCLDFSNFSTYYLTRFNLWKITFRMVEHSEDIAGDGDKMREPLVKLN